MKGPYAATSVTGVRAKSSTRPLYTHYRLNVQSFMSDYTQTVTLAYASAEDVEAKVVRGISTDLFQISDVFSYLIVLHFEADIVCIFPRESFDSRGRLHAKVS